jgi:thioredoxin 1
MSIVKLLGVGVVALASGVAFFVPSIPRNGCTSCSDVEVESFTFQGDGPSCSACAREAVLQPIEGDVISGEITETNPAAPTHADALPVANDDTFATFVHEESGDVLVDFYADWCGPCKMQGAILGEFSRANPSIKIVKVNVDESPKLAESYKISGIPALKVFRNKQMIADHLGVAQVADIESLLSTDQ